MSPAFRTSAIILLMTVAVVELSLRPVSAYVSTDSDDDWNAFKTRFAKTYKDSSDEAYRRNIRQENLKVMVAHNEEAEAGEHTFTMGENAFTDWTSEEYQSLLGFKTQQSDSDRGIRGRHASKKAAKSLPSMPTYTNTLNDSSLPSCVNWTHHGWVGEVLNQGKCGSCWAYSATGSLQSQHYNLTGTMVQLSQQNLIDCSSKEGNNGCKGGTFQDAFWYVQKNGIDSLAQYPDTSNGTGKTGKNCDYDSAKSVTSLVSWRNIESKSEAALQQAVATVGPVSVAIDAKHHSFQHYQRGVYSSRRCKSSQRDLDHAVLAVGYGVHINKPYWLVQNSWGTSWGMDGYIMMARGSNMCGIATDASFPVINQSAKSAKGVTDNGACPSKIPKVPKVPDVPDVPK